MKIFSNSRQSSRRRINKGIKDLADIQKRKSREIVSAHCKSTETSHYDTNLNKISKLNIFNTYPLWTRKIFPQIIASLPGIISTAGPSKVLKEVTVNHVHKTYLKNIWTLVYTNVSAQELVSDRVT
uniref:Uncharacterized protein n=1 Tax=Arion vulgaris TaxID=1028688 RepID=A0A0B7AG53_9EUPU